MLSNIENIIESWSKTCGLTPPVNLDRLCEDFKITVYKGPIPGVALCKRRIIVIDSRLSKIEQREQLAHEIAHILIHVGGQLVTEYSFVLQQEWQAERVSRTILIPRYLVSKFLSNGDSWVEMTKYLAMQFMVSEETMYQRMIEISEMMSYAGGRI